MKILKKLIITCVIILAIYSILLIPKVDSYITGKINSLSTINPIPEYIITSPDTYEEYDNPPFTYINDGKLFMLSRGHSINITPETADSNDFDYDINKSFRYKRNIKITNDYMVYLLEIDGENTLFKMDFAENNIIYISNKVDSFDITQQGDIIYSTGYIYSNNLYIYKYGESKLLAKNVKTYRLPEQNCLIIRSNDGKLEMYSDVHNSTKTLDTDVEEVYNPYAENRCYLKMTDILTVYYRKKSGDFVYTNNESNEISSFIEEVPEIIFETNTSGRYFYYKEKDKTLVLKDNDDTYGIMRDVYKIFKYDKENESFLLATSKAVYITTIGETNRENSIKLYNLKSIYKRNESMISNHLEVTTSDFKTIYTTRLAGSSFIFNIFNADSWLNRISSYKYKLLVSNIKNNVVDGLNELDVPKSSKKSDCFIQYETNRHLYITKNRKNKGNDVSSITDGKLDVRKPFEKEEYDTITAYYGPDYIYFVTYSKKSEDKQMLYVYVNDMPIRIHKGNFDVINSYSGIYLVNNYVDEDENVENMYTISRINSLQVEPVVNKVTFGK